MTYDEHKAATTTSTDNPTPDELDALPKISNGLHVIEEKVPVTNSSLLLCIKKSM